MSLSTALNIAQNSLLNSQRQTTVVSKNISNAYNENYSRRSVVISSLAPGNRIADVRRATDEALFRQNLSAISGWTAQSTIMDGLDRLNMAVNGVDNASAPATLLGKLQEAIQLYSSTPSNRTLGQNAIEAARSLVRSLNDGTSEIQKFRADMDSQIEQGVAELNALLSQFERVNNEIKLAITSGREALDAYDQRDELLNRISELVPISTITRANNDMMIVTADGMTLFESTPRPVQFVATPVYGSNTDGNQIMIDGVPLSKGVGANTSAGGTLAAMIQLRDDYADGLQFQLDEIARGLIHAFAEKQPNSALPPQTKTGLFDWKDGVFNFSGTDRVKGLAGSLQLHSGVDPAKLRDGINFDYNPGSDTDPYANFSDLLNQFLTAMDAVQEFKQPGNKKFETSLMTYSTGAISWLEDARKNADYGGETKSALLVRTAEALSNVTHVNVDEEMALMLELEQSYAASAKLLQMIDEMLKTLLSVVR